MGHDRFKCLLDSHEALIPETLNPREYTELEHLCYDPKRTT